MIVACPSFVQVRVPVTASPFTIPLQTFMPSVALVAFDEKCRPAASLVVAETSVLRNHSDYLGDRRGHLRSRTLTASLTPARLCKIFMLSL